MHETELIGIKSASNRNNSELALNESHAVVNEHQYHKISDLQSETQG